MIILNPDQLKAKQFFKTWWNSKNRFAILEGPAGVGKTTIILDLVKDLPNCFPLYTAPTNEACKQLENLLPENSLIYTTYSALGFHFNSDTENKQLTRVNTPAILNDINLLIVDEASMVGDSKNCKSNNRLISLFEAIQETGLKTLFVGHRSQLPEVNIKLNIFDTCESIIFNQDYPIYNLTTPERNKGELFEYINSLEKIIYKQPRLFKNTYSKNKNFLLDYINNKKSKIEFLNDESKIICWTNKEADIYNKLIRNKMFYEKHLPNFVPSDKLILTAPIKFLGKINNLKEGVLLEKNLKLTLSTNSKVTVKHVKQANVLSVPCWELDCLYNEERVFLYVPIDKLQLQGLKTFLLSKCYSIVTPRAKEKAFRNYHYIMSLFAEVKYNYAMTTHRSQGQTIDKVFVDWGDIKKCSNIILRHKLLYVAASRCKEELKIIV
jgi:exodeoxyribonuclease-5